MVSRSYDRMWVCTLSCYQILGVSVACVSISYKRYVGGGHVSLDAMSGNGVSCRKVGNFPPVMYFLNLGAGRMLRHVALCCQTDRCNMRGTADVTTSSFLASAVMVLASLFQSSLSRRLASLR